MRPSVMSALPANTGLSSGAGDLRLDRRRAAAAQVAVEALQDAEVGVAGGLHRQLVAIEGDLAFELELGALAGQRQLADLEDVLVERELDRPLVVEAVVEQLQVQALDVRVDDQVIDVRRARRRRGWCRRRRRS